MRGFTVTSHHAVTNKASFFATHSTVSYPETPQRTELLMKKPRIHESYLGSAWSLHMMKLGHDNYIVMITLLTLSRARHCFPLTCYIK